MGENMDKAMQATDSDLAPARTFEETVQWGKDIKNIGYFKTEIERLKADRQAECEACTMQSVELLKAENERLKADHITAIAQEQAATKRENTRLREALRKSREKFCHECKLLEEAKGEEHNCVTGHCLDVDYIDEALDGNCT